MNGSAPIPFAWMIFLFISELILFASMALAQEEHLPEQILNALQKRDAAGYLALVSNDAEIRKTEEDFFKGVLSFPYTTVNMRVADNSQGLTLLHIFFQNQQEARYEAWSIHTVLENGWTRIQERSTKSTIVGLYRLKTKPEAIPVSNFTFQQEDATFRLQKGHLFILRTGVEEAGVIFVGDGSFEFAPQDPIEQQQLSLFCKKNKLQTPLKHIYLRSSPENLQNILGNLLSLPGVANQALYSRALGIAKLYDADAFSVKVPLSEDLWYPRLERREFFAEIKTDYGTLIYQYSPRETEDVLLSLKEKEQIISFYKSADEKPVIASRDVLKVLSYDMKVASNPLSEYISGIAKMRLHSNETISSISLKLNPSLKVSQIRSSQGPLLYFQQSETNKLQVILNDPLNESEEILIELYYQGRISPDEGTTEVAMQDQSEANIYVPPTALYSNQSRWYPQLETDRSKYSRFSG